MKHFFSKVLPQLKEFIKVDHFCIYCGETNTDSKECKGTLKSGTKEVQVAQQAQGQV